MSKYECKVCNFSTTKKVDYVKHEQTKKHAKNIVHNPSKPMSKIELLELEVDILKKLLAIKEKELEDKTSQLDIIIGILKKSIDSE